LLPDEYNKKLKAAHVLSLTMEIDLGNEVDMSELSLDLLDTSGVSVDCSIADSSRTYASIPQTGQFAWSFATRKVRYIKLDVTVKGGVVTPYPMLKIQFSRGITHSTETKTSDERESRRNKMD
jgi:hypothetical protein